MHKNVQSARHPVAGVAGVRPVGKLGVSSKVADSDVERPVVKSEPVDGPYRLAFPVVVHLHRAMSGITIEIRGIIEVKCRTVPVKHL